MKKNYSVRETLRVIAAVFLLCACSTREIRIIIHPEAQSEEAQPVESWEMLESQNGRADALVPDWVDMYLNGLMQEIETLPAFSGKYIFIGENRGNNVSALRQWAAAFAVEQDVTRLVAARIEKRMISSTTLYPDDEYGDFFEAFVKAAIDTEYPDARIEDRFWLRRRIQMKATDSEEAPPPEERYEFLVLVSVDRDLMQNTIRAIMDGIKTSVPPSREQIIAINRIKQTFFEKF